MPSNNQGQGQGNNRGSNLSEEDRRRGGEASAEMQERDEQGQFAGTREQGGNRGGQGGRQGGNQGQGGSQSKSSGSNR